MGHSNRYTDEISDFFGGTMISSPFPTPTCIKYFYKISRYHFPFFQKVSVEQRFNFFTFLVTPNAFTY